VKYRFKKATYQEKLNYWILHFKHGIIAIILSEDLQKCSISLKVV